MRTLGALAFGPIVATCLLLDGCRSEPHPAASVPTASPHSDALPESNTAADAPQAPAVIESVESAESAQTRETAYDDPAFGVSFRYPSAWRPWHTGSTLEPPEFVRFAGPARITQVFDPQGTVFAKSNLIGLSFSFAVQKGLAPEACTRLAVDSTDGGTAASPETIRGVLYQRAEGRDAGMCHQKSFVVNTTFRGDRCFIFERDFATICPEVRGPGNPVALTPAQTAVLHLELDRVMSSVTLR